MILAQLRFGQIFQRGDFVYGRRFDTRGLAVQWAEEERKALEAEGGG